MMLNDGSTGGFCPCCGTPNRIAPNQTAAPTAPAAQKPTTPTAAQKLTAQRTQATPTVKKADGSRPYIFISYAHKDSHRVMPIISALAERGFNVWYDAGIEVGTEWPDFIAKKLVGSSCFITFLSKNYVESNNCKQEVEFAISRGKDVLSVYLEDFELPLGLSMRLGLYQSLFRTRFSVEKAFLDELAKAEILKHCKA